MHRKIVFGLLCGLVLQQSHGGMVRIYAASSLNNALSDVEHLYEAHHAQSDIVSVFAGSSLLAKQISHGAPADLFFSADTEWMNYLVKNQYIDVDKVKPVLGNMLVLVAPKNSHIRVEMRPQFPFAQSFTGKLCTGDMTSVPVGKYAQEALQKLNWLSALRGRIVGTENVRAALRFVERAECQVGIVYQTDARMSQKVKQIGVFPVALYRPIIYPLALTQQGKSNAEAVRFQRFILNDPKARQIFQHYGFQLR